MSKKLVEVTNGSEIRQIPASQLNQVSDSGWRLASPEELREKHVQNIAEQQTGRALSEGLESALLLGSNDRKNLHGGTDWENEIAQARRDTGAFTAGQVVGTGVGMLAPGGIAGARALGSGAAKLAAKSGAKGGVAKTTGLAAEGAVEGAVFGAHQAISEAALGDVDVAAEKLLASAGKGALVGFGVGGAVGGTAIGGSNLLKKKLGDLSESLEAVSKKTKKTADNLSSPQGVKTASKAPDIPEATDTGYVAKAAEWLSKRHTSSAAQGAKPLGRRIQDNFINYSKNKKAAEKTISKMVTQQVSDQSKVEQTLLDVMMKTNVDEASTLGAVAPKFQRTASDFKERFSGTSGVDKGKVDGYLRSIINPAESVEHQAVIEGIRAQKETANSLIESGLVTQQQKKVLEGVRSRAAAFEQKAEAIGEQMGDAHAMQAIPGHIAKKLGADGGMGGSILGDIGGFAAATAAGGPLGAAANLASNPRNMIRAIDVMSAITGRINNFDKKIDGAMSVLVGGKGKKPGTRLKDLALRVDKAAKGAKAASDKIRSPGPKTLSAPKSAAVAASVSMFGSDPKKRRAEYERIEKAIRNYQIRPEAYLADIGRATEGMSEFAPGVASNIVAGQTRLAGYLADHLPPRLGDTANMLQPHLSSREPTDAEVSEFLAKAAVVADPESVIRDAQNGLLTTSSVQVLRETRPHVYQKMQEAAMVAIAETREELPYETVLQVSLLLDIPGHPTLNPEFQASHSAIMSQAQEQAEQASAPSVRFSRSKGAPSHANRIMTESEKASELL